MAYEREAISDSAIPQPAQPIMREDKVVDPYAVRAPKTALPDAGQSDSTKESLAVETKPTEETVKLAPQVAALARKEQKFRMQMQELEREKASLAAERSELADLRARKDKLAAKDYSALDGLIDYNDYSQYQVNKLNGADPTLDAVKKLEAKLGDLEKSQADNVTKQFEAAVSERRIATKALVETSADFPRIRKAKAEEAVVQHILDTWEHDSKELTVQEAAKEVEEILVEKAKQWAALLEDEKVEAAAGEKKTLPPLKQGLKTLTNQVTAADVKRPQKSYQHMSDQERYAEARRRVEERSQKQG